MSLPNLTNKYKAAAVAWDENCLNLKTYMYTLEQKKLICIGVTQYNNYEDIIQTFNEKYEAKFSTSRLLSGRLNIAFAVTCTFNSLHVELKLAHINIRSQTLFKDSRLFEKFSN